MASKVLIVSSAIQENGGTSVSSLTENDQARYVGNLYERCLKAMLRSHPWSFNKKEASLPLVDETPLLTDDFDYIFALPSDFIRLNKTNIEDTYAHKIKGKKLYSQSNTIKIEYGYFLDDPAQYDDCFIDAFISRLAAESCYFLTRDKALKKEQWEVAIAKMNLAKNMNSQEVTPDSVQNDKYINARS